MASRVGRRPRASGSVADCRQLCQTRFVQGDVQGSESFVAKAVDPNRQRAVPVEHVVAAVESRAHVSAVFEEHSVERKGLSQLDSDGADELRHAVQQCPPLRVDEVRLSLRSFDHLPVPRSPVAGIDREQRVLHRLVEVAEAELLMKMVAEGRAI